MEGYKARLALEQKLRELAYAMLECGHAIGDSNFGTEDQVKFDKQMKFDINLIATRILSYYPNRPIQSDPHLLQALLVELNLEGSYSQQKVSNELPP
jgi:hypothetical protein